MKNDVLKYNDSLLCKPIASHFILSSSRDILPDVESLVRSYMRKMVDESNMSVWQCIECGKTTRISTNLKDHIEANHLKGLRFSCPRCCKTLKSRASLRIHMRLHTTQDQPTDMNHKAIVGLNHYEQNFN